MLTLLKNGKVYAPEFIGVKDVLILHDKIGMIADNIDLSGCPLEHEVYDLQGRYLVPGFIDQHVHIIGGGGEAGFYSRTPEVMLSGAISNGITTMVGVLGTDGTTRHLESLYAKAAGLETEGITTYMYTGSYQIPPVTITGSVRKDIIMIDRVIGAGEIAISDHRSSEPSKHEMTRIATEVRLGGMLSGKLGVLNLHMGNGKNGLNMVFEILRDTEIPIRHFIPTHITRKRELFEQSMEFAKIGGTIDMTAGVDPDKGFAGSIKTSKAIMECLEKGVPLEKITISSDGNGSMAVYNDKGKVERLLVTQLDGLSSELTALVNNEGLELGQALKTVTSNVAAALGIDRHKGRLQQGFDADIVIMEEDLTIKGVYARGRKMMENSIVLVKGTFE